MTKELLSINLYLWPCQGVSGHQSSKHMYLSHVLPQNPGHTRNDVMWISCTVPESYNCIYGQARETASIDNINS